MDQEIPKTVRMQMGKQQFQRLTRALGETSGEELRFSVRAAALAPWVEGSLAMFGLAATLKAVERIASRGSNPRAIDGFFAERAVARAFRLQPWLPGKCLVRALVQYGLHRLDGTRAKLVVGVRRLQSQKLDAHAWVEPPERLDRSAYEPIFSRTTP